MGKRVLGLVVVAAVVVGACGGGDDTPSRDADPASAAGATTIGPDGGSVTSDDGRFTLTVPAGALDTGTDITLTKSPASEWDDDIVEAEPVAVYRMEPDGLEFATPAVGSLAVDASGDADEAQLPISLSYTDDGFELLTGQSTRVDLSAGTTTVGFEVPHFSFITVVDSAVVAQLAQIEPIDRPAGQRFAPFAGIRNTGNLTLETEEIRLMAIDPVNVVAGLDYDLNPDPIEHSDIEIPGGSGVPLSDPEPEYVCTRAGPPTGFYGFEASVRVGGDIVAEIVRRVRRISPFTDTDWRWYISIYGQVECTAAVPGSPTTTTIQSNLDETESDPCAGGICVGYGDSSLFDGITGGFNWSSTGCESTPESNEGEVPIGPGPTGARIDIPGLGGSISIGGGILTANGSGLGGTITSNGVTTGRQRDIEIIEVDDDGFQARVEQQSGPVGDDGELIADQATCDDGGIVDFSTDPTTWAAWLDLPRFDEPPISAGGGFECIVETGDDGTVTVFFWVPLEVAPPDPPSPFDIRFDVFIGDNPRVEPDTVESTFDIDLQFNGVPTPGEPPPAALGVSGHGVRGAMGIEHIAGVEPGGTFYLVPLDVQPIVGNGAVSIFVPSKVCGR